MIKNCTYGIGAIKFGEPGKYFPESIKQCKNQMTIIEDIDKIFVDADKQSAQAMVKWLWSWDCKRWNLLH